MFELEVNTDNEGALDQLAARAMAMEYELEEQIFAMMDEMARDIEDGVNTNLNGGSVSIRVTRGAEGVEIEIDGVVTDDWGYDAVMSAVDTATMSVAEAIG